VKKKTAYNIIGKKEKNENGERKFKMQNTKHYII
jgi:hypothetical protein